MEIKVDVSTQKTKISTEDKTGVSEARVKEKLALYDPAIKSLRITLKNSMFYKSDHPIFTHSINNLKTALDAFFQIRTKMDIGILENNLFFEDGSIKGNL